MALVGDSYQSACPSTGTGLSKVLTDVDVLCNVCVPLWMATPGMGVEKINEYYDNATERAGDSFSLGAALHSREVALGSTRFNRLQQTPAWVRTVRYVKGSRLLAPLGTTVYDRVLAFRGRRRDGADR